MKSNRVTLIGFVGSHLSTRKLENGSKRVSIRMATHYSQKKESGEKIYQTVWHNVVAWDNVADYAEKSLVKGSRLMVDGSITYRTYPDKQGHLRYMTMITADSIMNLDR
jgi:single-strand DNA-binding protein